MSRRFAAALFAATVLASPAFADLPTPKHGWRTGAMRSSAGEFAYCVSEAEYTNGLWLILALNPEAGVNLGMGMPGAAWTVGAENAISIQIDTYPAQTVRARVTKPELMVVSAGSNPALIEALSRSNSITIDGKAFALKGSGRAIAELRDCVDHKGVPPSERGAVAAAAPAQPAQPPLIQQGDATSSPAETSSVAAPTGDAISAAVAQPLRAQYGTEMVAGSALPGARGQAPSPFAPPSAPPEPSPFAPAPAAPASAHAGSETSDPTPTSEVAAVLGQAETPAPLPSPAPAPVAPPSAPAAMPAVAPAPVAAPAASASVSAKPLPAQLLHLLTTAGVRDLTPASEAGSAFAWRARGVKGHVVEMAVSPNTDLMQLVRRHQADLGAQCSARYSSAVGTLQSAGPVTILTADSLCRGANQNTFTTFVYALSSRGVLSIISHEQAPGADGTANRIQSGLVKALKETQG